MQLTLGTDSLTPPNIVVIVIIVVIPIATLPATESGGMYKERYPRITLYNNSMLSKISYIVLPSVTYNVDGRKVCMR